MSGRAAAPSPWLEDWAKGVSLTQRVEVFLKKIARQAALNAFVEVFEQSALERAADIDARRQAGAPLGPLAGMVVALKDNILMKGHRCTASSRILEGFEAPYSATAVHRLLEADAVVIGRTGCDEFAMGSSNETSYYGLVRNPLDPERVPGGSSGGSAAAVAAGLCDAALGSDTGGSIRQPAAFCGLWGMKPTYGAVSRYGLIAYGSSFDQIGPMTTSPEDAALLMQVISGPDPYDATSDVRFTFQKSEHGAQERVVSLGFFPELLEGSDIEEPIRKAYQDCLERARILGCVLKPIELPMRSWLVPLYYVLSTAEASSNLARYDGVRYGYRSSHGETLEQMQVNTRTEGFGAEVRRRILLGTFVLSSGYYDAYYSKALKARALLCRRLENLFNEVHFLLLPTTPGLPFRFGERSADPVKMYLEDQFTVMANLTGHPALNFPWPCAGDFPVCGLQIMGPRRSDADLLAMAGRLVASKF
ncbi:MAG: Asp-tRNA(Asn)/Glu-tRNA(Gln) amidotransferase subunit GatA [Flavobacteriales bacterium]|nr:Asp-tRNA(Asn)/Glu-tRNA(Gln) amidotransferase subunit GatA [Flavobacteriales bacterium]MDW8432786.1 Asp-tRNA(Asn)/Glu-tRNA(Gln) amidotransferase subunit GatA [Flavobacteriales bacterium]